MHRFKTPLTASLLFLAAFLVRILIIVQPIPVQLDKSLPDDAYYYFLTARNVVAGKGPSVDGLTPSNGWHPLWLLVNIGVFATLDTDPDLPVRTVLVIGAICDSLVPVSLFFALRRLQSQSAPIIGALAYALNIMPVFQAVNGLETGLANLMLVLAWLTTYKFMEHPRALLAVCWGGIFGFTFLARTDTALVLLCVGIYATWRLRYTPKLLVLGAITALVVVAPWLIWNYVNFGAPLDQVSGIAVPWAARARTAAAQPDSPLYLEGLRVLFYPVYWLRGDYIGAPPVAGYILWLFGIWGIIHALSSPSRDARELGKMTLVLLVGGALLVFVHTAVRWYPRPWYFVITAQSLALALGLFWNEVQRVSVRLGTLTIGLSSMAVSTIFAWSIGLYPWQSTHQYTAALWTRDHLQSGTRLSSMNSGIIGYYSGLDTVNLDGVVNPQAFAALQSYSLLSYMQANGVDYLIDSDNAIYGEYALFMGDSFPDELREVEVITAEYPGLGFVRLYQIE